MHSDINSIFVDNVQAALTELRSVVGAYSGSGGFGVEVGEPPIRINLVEISVSDLHKSNQITIMNEFSDKFWISIL